MDYPPTATEGQAGLVSLGKAYNPTVEENIDNRIKAHLDEVSRLEALKKLLPEGLLKCHIGDLRTAMHI